MMTKIIAVRRSKKKGLGKSLQALSIDTTPSFRKEQVLWSIPGCGRL
jgi:hypothetical protein